MVFIKIQKLQLDDTSKKIWGNFFYLKCTNYKLSQAESFPRKKKREIHDRNFREF